MTPSMKIRDDARSAAIKIKRAAESGREKSENFRFQVDFLKDSIIELASKLEFGYVAELSALSKHLLNQASLQNRKTRFKLSVEDMLYLINTFPCAPDGVINFVSSDFTVNKQIAQSVVRSNSHYDTHFISDNFLLMLRLARVGDLDSWIELSRHTLENHSNADLVLRTLSEFDILNVEENREKLRYLTEAIKDFKAGYFPDEYMGEKVKFQNLLYNLRAIEAISATHSLIHSSSFPYPGPFTLQQYITDFDFKPNEAYRRDAARRATSPHVDTESINLSNSFFAYELSTDEPLCQLDNTPSPALLKRILELDGSESPSGTIRLNPQKVGSFLDTTFIMALKDMNGDWDKVIKEYRKIDEKTLMQSKLYKVRRLENELGM